MNLPAKLKSGQSLGGQWRTINGQMDVLSFRAAQLEGAQHFPIASANGRMRQMFRPEPMFPFRIYQLPVWYRETPDPTTDWLKFSVRAGLIVPPAGDPVLATGGDDEEFGYDESFPVDDTTGAGVNEFTITADVAKYWFWVNLGSAEISAGTSLPGSNCGLLGYVDTTDVTNKFAHIRQIQFGDIIKTRFWRNVWDLGTTYNFQDVVIIESGVSAGTYISDIDDNNHDPATGVGWTQIAYGDASAPWI